MLRIEVGQFELETPRDRQGDFEQNWSKNIKRALPQEPAPRSALGMDDNILFLYAQGMTTREIVTAFKEMYGADVSASLISKVTDAVIEQVIEW